MSKEYQVPEEIQELFDEARALGNCRDAAVKNFFGAGRAIKYAKQQVKASNKAWRMVFDLYPELKDKSCTFQSIERVVTVNE